MIQIQTLTAYHPDLLTILQDSVEHGASIGFLLPFEAERGTRYWANIFTSLAAGERILLGAFQDKTLVGTVQLEFCQKQNGQHRAEVQKLMVHSAARRQGIARELMLAIETVALAHQRSLLVLDTIVGSAAEKLYRQVGYQTGGIIPQYALSTEGILEPTIFLYKLLDRSSIDSQAPAH